MDRDAPHRRALSDLLLQRRRLLALLLRGLGLDRLELAEEALQAACLKALEHWARDGLPAQPAAWLYRVAQRHLIDELRLTRRLQPVEEASVLDTLGPPVLSTERLQGELLDEELALLFGACHPALPLATQVLLALRALAGLTLEQLAPLFFSTPAALAQRLARARETLAAQAPLRIPAGAELPERIEAVLHVLALMFHQGQQAAGRSGLADDLPPRELALQPCWEAIRLARALCAHAATAAPESDALAALLLLHGARLSGRVDANGDFVPLAGQARERWDAGLIARGMAHLQASQRGERLSRWHLLAGIAAEHARAPNYARTDWPAIVRYYSLLRTLDPSAAPQLGHAIALAEAGNPEQALQELQSLLPQLPAALRAHGLAACARAHLRAGRVAAAQAWLAQAVAAAPQAADARMLERAWAEASSAAATPR
ncbi:RNA polymerase sigma-70 factor (ECF subfamily) [Inhella inkyongensis]|uniref:RNA polymerase sigma-70 factor (ECF subfamily) n=1 Tax=Inhella inkyongensis TaxID=392593 RepID=A0A840SAD7_9BURK|nr:DUF6596 domain-containing protein [Inhella inkyongensis]MBB5205976.1 RNA polymerase sigma-70 factor (ECF subfamily) [Inhella inkyongensis]